MTDYSKSCGLLFVFGDPVFEQQLDAIFEASFAGIACWDEAKAGQPIDTELLNFINKNPTPESAEDDELVIRDVVGNIYIEVLLNPSVSLLCDSLRHFLVEPFHYKHIVHAGPAFSSNGAWAVKDGTLSAEDFARLLSSSEANAYFKIHPDTFLQICCNAVGGWTLPSLEKCGVSKQLLNNVRICQLKTDAVHRLQNFNYGFRSLLEQHIRFRPFDVLMPGSTLAGNLRFTRPAFYVFPGGQGDSALFGISGFTLLLDGGYDRKPSCWDFIRHIDRVDALLLTRLNNSHLLGMSSLISRCANDQSVYPRLGHVFVPGEIAAAKTENAAAHTPPTLLIESKSVINHMQHDLQNLGLKAQSCMIDPAQKTLEPMILYQKLGHGKLLMYVLNPIKKGAVKGGSAGIYGLAGYAIPTTCVDSIAILLVWLPADPSEKPTRILYPGSCPQQVLFKMLEKLKTVDYLKHPEPLSKVPQKVSGDIKNPIATTITKPTTTNSNKPMLSPRAAQASTAKSSAPTAAVSPKAETKQALHLAETSESALIPAEPSPLAEVEPQVFASVGHAALKHVNLNQVSPGAPASTQSHQQSPDLFLSSGHHEVAPSNLDFQSQFMPDSTHHVQGAHSPLSGEEDEELRQYSHGHQSERGQYENQAFHVEEGNLLDDSTLNANANVYPEISASPQPPINHFASNSATDYLNELNGGLQQQHLPADLADFGHYENTCDRHSEGADQFAEGADYDLLGADDAVVEENHVHNHGHQNSYNQKAEEFVHDVIESVNDEILSAVGHHHGFDGGEDGTHKANQDQHSGDHDDSEAARLAKPSIEQLQQEWGKPLGLPTPPSKASAAPKPSRLSAANNTGTAKQPPAPKAAPSATARQPLASTKTTAATTSTVVGRAGVASTAPRASAASSTGRKSLAGSVTQAAKSTAAPSSKSAPTPATKAPAASGPVAAVSAVSNGSRQSSAASIKRASTGPAKKPPAASTSAVSGTFNAGPMYFDLVVIPHHGNPHYVDVEFFRQLRSRYYVLSGLSPAAQVLEALLQGKKAWAKPEMPVTLIPTYDTDTLQLWMNLHTEQLDTEHIDVAPSAQRCTLNLQDYNSSCAAYRLEF